MTTDETLYRRYLDGDEDALGELWTATSATFTRRRI